MKGRPHSICPASGLVAQPRKSKRRQSRHSGDVRCPVCNQTVSTTKQGVIREHHLRRGEVV